MNDPIFHGDNRAANHGHPGTPNPTPTAKSPGAQAPASAMEPASPASSKAVGPISQSANGFTRGTRIAVWIGFGGAAVLLGIGAVQYIGAVGWVAPAVQDVFRSMWPTALIFGCLVSVAVGYLVGILHSALRAENDCSPEVDAGLVPLPDYAEAIHALADARSLVIDHHEDVDEGLRCVHCVNADGESPTFERICRVLYAGSKRLNQTTKPTL